MHKHIPCGMHNYFRYTQTHAASGSGASKTNIFNMPKLMSSINRKEFHNVDYSGNAQLYTIGLKLFGSSADVEVFTAPNTYATQKAVKAWHDARVKMYRRAGIRMKDLGYGRSLRPYLTVAHENGSTNEMDGLSNNESNMITPHFVGDEWTYSRAAVATPIEAGEIGSGTPKMSDFVDTYSFTLCDASVPENVTVDDPTEASFYTDQDSFVSVGMISEWLDSFKKRAAGTDAGGLEILGIDADNALLQLESDQGPQVEEVLELAESGQKEARPWQGLNTDGHYTSLNLQAFGRTLLNGSDYIVFQAPCGLFQLNTENKSDSLDIVSATMKVLAIEDM